MVQGAWRKCSLQKGMLIHLLTQSSDGGITNHFFSGLSLRRDEKECTCWREGALCKGENLHFLEPDSEGPVEAAGDWVGRAGPSFGSPSLPQLALTYLHVPQCCVLSLNPSAFFNMLAEWLSLPFKISRMAQTSTCSEDHMLPLPYCISIISFLIQRKSKEKKNPSRSFLIYTFFCSKFLS